MSEDDEKSRQFEWLRAEQDLANERLSAYTEADQKIIAVIGTIVVAVIGISTSKFGDINSKSIPYIFFIASILMSLAVNQSSLYSSLALIYLERKFDLAKRMGDFLSCDPDFTYSHSKMFAFRSLTSYRFAIVPYYLFKVVVSFALSIAGGLSMLADYKDWRFDVAFSVSMLFSTLSAAVVVSHAVAADRFFKLARNIRVEDRQ